MEREQLLRALHATTNEADAKQAGDYLESCTKLPGFTPELLKIVVSQDLPDDLRPSALRQAAVIFLKNTIIKYWGPNDVGEDKENQQEYTILDQDKTFVRENIVEAICFAPNVAKVHLANMVQTILRVDFPDRWPNLTQKLIELLGSHDAAKMHASLLVIYKIAKVYEYRRAKERIHLVDSMKHMLPLIYTSFQGLLPNPSEESVLLQKIILKIFFALIQFSLNLDMLPIEVLDPWLTTVQQVIERPVPPEVASIEDKDEAAHTVWWKAKKWAAKILERIFDRYGAPGQVEKGYAEFANHFIGKFAIPCVEAFLRVLEAKRQNQIVSDRVLHLAINFLNTAVSHATTWKIIKPHMLDVVKLVLFPLLCHSDEDEELWDEDVQEYIRFKFDIFEDLHNPAYAAGALLTGISKRKDTMQPLLGFIIQILSSSQNPREIEGALHMVGELSTQLCKSKKYKKDVEKLIEAHITPRILAEQRFVRARAAWCIKSFSGANFQHKSYLNKIVQSIVQCLINDNELPCKVESALALQYLLNDQGETVQTMLRPLVKDVIPKVLELVAKTQIEEICGVMDQLIEDFMDEVIPIATKLSETLSNMFVEVISQDEIADDRAPTLMSVVSTLSNILDVVDDHKDIMMQVEMHVTRVIKAVFEMTMIDYYDDIIMLMQSLINSYVSEMMWSLFGDVVTIFKETNNVYILFSDVMPLFHQYLVTDTEGFLARPERLNACFEMCQLVLQDSDQGDENQVHAAKLLECLLLQCQGAVNSAIPAIIVLVLQRLSQPFEGLTELKPMLIVVLIAAVYTNVEVSINTFKEIAPQHSNPLDFLTEEMINITLSLEGIHSRKMVIFAWCTLLRLPASARPTLINYEPTKVIEVCIAVFEGLEKAMKLQAENAKFEEEDSDEESDDDEDLPKRSAKKGGGNKHRDMDQDLADSEDEIDEGTLQYLQTLAKQHKSVASGSEADDSSADEDSGDEYEVDETETEAYLTPVDTDDSSQDPFVMFKQTMEEFEQKEPALFNQMIGPLDVAAQNCLRKLIMTCAQHAQHEESKKLEQAGGYDFAQTDVPTAFNFTQ